MAEEVLLRVQLLIAADHVHEDGQARLGTDSGHVELLPRQQDRDAEGLLERGIGHGGQRDNLVVLTSAVQVGRRPAEVRGGFGYCGWKNLD